MGTQRMGCKVWGASMCNQIARTQKRLKPFRFYLKDTKKNYLELFSLQCN